MKLKYSDWSDIENKLIIRFAYVEPGNPILIHNAHFHNAIFEITTDGFIIVDEPIKAQIVSKKTEYSATLNGKPINFGGRRKVSLKVGDIYRTFIMRKGGKIRRVFVKVIAI